MRIRVLVLAMVVLVTGCFDGDDSGGGEVNSTSVIGLLRMEDIGGNTPLAYIDARFLERNDPPTSIKKLSALESPSLNELLASHGKGLNLSHTYNRFTPLRVATAYLDAGSIQFQMVSTSKWLEIPKGDNNRYLGGLEAAIEEGSYLVKGMGSEKVTAFSEKIAMPELLTNVTASGVPFGDNDVTIDKTQTLSIQWDAPEALFEGSIMILYIIAESTDGDIILTGAVKEKEFHVEGASTYVWNISSEQLQPLPISTNSQTEIYYTRAISYENQTGKQTVDLEGWRTQFTFATVE